MFRNRTSKTQALLFIAALLNLLSLTPLTPAAPAVKAFAVPLGELAALGQVSVDGVPAKSGTTIFSGNLIRTEERSGAIIGLGQLGRMELRPQTSLRLSFDRTGFVGQLETGSLRISLPAKSSARIMARNMLSVASSEAASLFTIEAGEGRTRVATQAGCIEVSTNEGTQKVCAGEEATFGAGDGDTLARTGRSQNPGHTGNGRLLGFVIALSGVLTAIVLIISLSPREQPPQETQGGCCCCVGDPSPAR